jgi:hypothetical protein
MSEIKIETPSLILSGHEGTGTSVLANDKAIYTKTDSPGIKKTSAKKTGIPLPDLAKVDLKAPVTPPPLPGVVAQAENTATRIAEAAAPAVSSLPHIPSPTSVPTAARGPGILARASNAVGSALKWSWNKTPTSVKLASGAAAAAVGLYALASYARNNARVTEQKLQNADREMEKAALAQMDAAMEAGPASREPVGPMTARELARRGQIPARADAVQQPVPQVAEGQQVADLGAPSPGR